MVMTLITTPRETESVFSRGKESSTLTDDTGSDGYDGHLLVHEEDEMESNRRSRPMPREPGSSSPSDYRPPRHPGHFSFSDVGRRKRDLTSQNPFDTSSESNSMVDGANINNNGSQDTASSNEVSHSNSLLDGRNLNRPIAPPRVASPAPSSNPFDESSSAEFVEAHYPAKDSLPSLDENKEQQFPSVFEQRTHSWDSDRQFPILEIERIKRKTKKLRSPARDEAEDDGFGNESKVFPRTTTPTTASCTTGAPQSDARSNYNGMRHYQQHSLSPQSPYSQAYSQGVSRANSRTPPPPSTAVRTNRYFPAADSLADVLDQRTIQTDSSSVQTPRSKSSERAEKQMLESFQKPGRPRNQRPLATAAQQLREPSRDSRSRSRSTSITSSHDEKKEDDVRSNPRGVGLYGRSSAGTSDAAAVNRPPSPPPDTHKSKVLSESMETEDHTAAETSRDSSRDTSHDTPSIEHLNLTLHDLCGEATNPDDIAWRNALYLLSLQPHLASVVDAQEGNFTPLHVCCLGPERPPSFMILALLYTYPVAAQTPDEGGRLPLHLVAASSADSEAMQLLVNEYPAAVSHVDDYGMTPLHLYLRSVQTGWEPEKVQILLGQTTSMIDNIHKSPKGGEGQVDEPHHFLFRRGSHFKLPAQDVRRVLQRPRPVTRFTKVDHEAAIAQYAPDVQVSLRKLSRRKTKLQHQNAWADGHDNDPTDADDVSPAAIPAPATQQLPIHVVIQRAMQQEEQQHFSTNDEEDDEDAEVESSPSGSSASEREELVRKGADADAEQPSINKKSTLTDPKVMEVMRLLISAFPEGLSVCDGDGFTPLLMVLAANEKVPDFELVLLLLGRRTPTGANECSADRDLPLHAMSSSPMWMNPAMVPATWTKQLPLHIVAEEYPSEIPLVQAIFEAYPAAIQVQDAQGRTPLHLALSSYRKIPVDPRVMNMFFSETVAQTRDRKGQLALDVMLENSRVLPDAVPWAWKLAEANDPAVGSVYKRFFHASLLHLASSVNGKEGRDFLHDLQVLPQWMRRQACVSTFVQELLIEEIATPWKCALILLDGLLLVGLLTVFRLQMNEYIVTGSALANWYTFAVYAFGAARFVFLGGMAALASTLGMYQETVLWNLWWWIDYAAMILAIVTSILFNGRIEEDLLLILGSAATGFLWWSVIGYVSRWSFAMAVFSGMLSQLANYLLYIFVALGAVVVATGQMLYTVFQTNCEDAIAFSTVCTVRDAYRVIYLLLRGESLADVDGQTQMTPEAITMVATFLFCLLMVVVGLLAVVVLISGQADVDELARASYWEPMLAYVLSMNTLGFSGRSRKTCGDGMSTKLGIAWDVLTLHFSGQREYKDKMTWFARPRRAWVTWPLAAFSFLILPVWFLLGLVTLGFLWPPQLRRALFRPRTLWQRRRAVMKSSEATTQQIHALRSEATKFKVLSYDRMMGIESEIRELKDLLYLAMREDTN